MLNRAIQFASLTLAALMSGAVLAAPATSPKQWIDAELVKVNPADSTITVRFDENEATRTFHVTKNAQLEAIDDSGMHYQIALSDMRPGAQLELEFAGVYGKGKDELRKIMQETKPASRPS